MRIRRGPLVPLIVLLASVGLTTGIVAGSLPAAAATTGAGVAGITPYGGYLGNYVAPDGTRVYCIDSARDWPSGPTGAGHLTGDVRTAWGTSLDATTLRKINFVLTEFGQTTHPQTAAAVNAYLYAFTGGRARTHGPGYSAGLHFINGNQAVAAVYATVWAAAEASAHPAPSASVVIEMTTPLQGVVRVTATPSQAVGTLELIGAVVADTGSSTVAVVDGAEIEIRGVPMPGEAVYDISATASFKATAPPGPAVTLYLTGSQQRTVRHAPPAEFTFGAATTTGPISLPFAPVIASQVEKPTVVVGEPLVDALTVTLVDPEGVWPQHNGTPLPIVAVGTLYGPLPTEPVQSDAPPADAPVAGTARVTLTGAGSYVSDGTLVPPAEGYYTWVWRISAEDQADVARAALGADYLFADRFGLPTETVRVTRPPELAATGGSDQSPAWAGIALLALGALALAFRRYFEIDGA